ncbi:MAG: BamA/TamA family outer membrane protein, partial [Candidatus Omnitrophota bacterium]
KKKVPGSESTFYDAARLVVFYDWAATQYNRVSSGEKKRQTLKGTGVGLRFNLPENFSLRVECAYPLGKTPSDENHLHTYLSVSKKF